MQSYLQLLTAAHRFLDVRQESQVHVSTKQSYRKLTVFFLTTLLFDALDQGEPTRISG